ncbi:MAG: tryptophanase [Bacilli bacterium]|jgi:tryptophanase|nr:tryptophanase [Bacilli bacterium]MDY0399823.1 tryptophanase [Bacilli bacterium]HKM11331.1 tryptophanase [Bacilli bacterium]
MQHFARFQAAPFPMEMHKVRVIQKLTLLPIKERLAAIVEAGNNTFLLKNRDVFLDMLTDSGTNAMSDRQIAAMSLADDSYAGSETFFRLEASVQDFFGLPFFLPAHQGRACEHILAKVFVKPGNVVPMNFHFTTTRAHIMECGGRVEECFLDEAIRSESDNRFKGNMDLHKLENCIASVGINNVPFVRVELGTNLIGGQPISLSNLEAVSAICRKHQLLLVIDSSLLSDNLYFMKMFDPLCEDLSIKEINHRISACADIIYFSARKLSSARGGGLVMRDKLLFDKMKVLIPLYEGFLTYGGMSVREMEAMAIGLQETLDFDMIAHGPQFIEAFGNKAKEQNIPVITPFGGLGLHVDARAFLEHIPGEQYPAGALAAAIYIVSGARGMERGTISENRNPDGSEHVASMELVRLALPRRVFTLSQITYMVDRLAWLYENRALIGGLTFVDEPTIMRFFIGRLAPIGDWQTRLVDKFIADFGSDAL